MKIIPWEHKGKYLGEVRCHEDDGSIDEIVVDKCHFHLEQMSDGVWWIGITVKGQTMRINLYTRRAPVYINAETDCGTIAIGFKDP